MRLPVVRIRYAWLLDPVYRELVRSSPKYRDKRYPSARTIVSRVAAYRRAWKKDERALLGGMCRASGLRFAERMIDVHIVGKGYHPFSYPLVISSIYEPEQFVDVLAHELIHHLFVDNTKNVNILPLARALTPRRNRTVQSHVLLHAIHQYLFLDVLRDDQRLRREVAWAERWRDYRDSWKIVKQLGYQTILKKMRKQYR